MKKTSLQWLGIIAMICAPGLMLETHFYDEVNHQNTSIGGMFDLLYMIGWMCSIYGLLQLRAAGTKRAGNIILYVQLGLLAVANVWNIWEIIDPLSNHPVFRALDFFWPISNIFMLVTGIAILVAKRLPFHQRLIPLLVGLWRPVTMLPGKFSGGQTGIYIMNAYSVTTWFLMGLVVFFNRNKQINYNPSVAKAFSLSAIVNEMELAENNQLYKQKYKFQKPDYQQ